MQLEVCDNCWRVGAEAEKVSGVSSVGSEQRVKNFGNFATWESEARDFRVLFPDNEIGV